MLGKRSDACALRVPAPSSDCGVAVVFCSSLPEAHQMMRSAGWPLERVTFLTSTRLERLHERMSAIGDTELVLDTRSSWGLGQLRRWRHLFPHIVRGGAWVAARTAPVAGKRERLAERLQAGSGPIRVVQPKRHLLKIPDAAAQRVLVRREPGLTVTVLAELPGGTFTPRRRRTDHGAVKGEGLPDRMPYPSAVLRRYEGPVRLHRGAYAVSGASLLPESFRWHLNGHPVNEALRDSDARFAQVRRARAQEPVAALSGSYYYLDYRSTGHYGHFMTEALARLWGWHEAKAEDPDLKVLLRHHANGKRLQAARPETRMLPALGIDLADVAWIEGDVEVESLVGCTPLWHNADPYHLHPAILDVWSRLRDGLEPQPSRGLERVFVTRREGNRPCRNVEAVERMFEEEGFVVVHPGELTVQQQASTFAGARVVAGFGGTGMFNLVFAQALETVIVLNHNGYQARNEHLFAAAHGVESHFFWSEPEAGPTRSDHDYRVHQSSWTFDFEANSDLPGVLAATR